MQLNSREPLEEQSPSTLVHHNSFTLPQELTESLKGHLVNTGRPTMEVQQSNRRVAPEYRRLPRYTSLSVREIQSLPVADLALDKSHMYLWVPNALIQEGLAGNETLGIRV